MGARGDHGPPRSRRSLGPEEVVSEVAERTAEPGVATGLAWTAVGGDILFIEASRMPGKGKLTLTGSSADAVKESVTAAASFVRGRVAALGLTPRATSREHRSVTSTLPARFPMVRPRVIDVHGAGPLFTGAGAA
ncbi:MAG: hypothetical protein IPQ07_44820 [Myxococcales bacterium]|nr:hypothetical protein [Myxococcales bacterium]